ncbi:hypothetical protein D7Y21_13605 [Corallococcus sp. AB045]|uniref:hypothetical protein n=1 Tax=Corallococcus sp. AB045 TaxID=2316719 RepID=UPI000EBFDB48|nr:hypothetical protein [Corallococcus sp. AB045]RKH88753.1 hypothetical protein D7Y21_13605 [Corallococcus sp. AB045]
MRGLLARLRRRWVLANRLRAPNDLGGREPQPTAADLQRSECLCGAVAFQIVSGVALYEGTQDVRWLYVACFCPACGFIGVHSDWRCEGGEADAFLART